MSGGRALFRRTYRERPAPAGLYPAAILYGTGNAGGVPA